MSSIWLGSIVGIGLLVLVGIAYGAHRLEMSKIENRRKASMHKDRYRDIQFVVDVIPNESLQGDLSGLLTSNMVMHLQKASDLDPNNLDLQRQLKECRGLNDTVGKVGALPKKAQAGSIGDSLKDVQRGVKLLKEFILLQHRTGFLSKAVATEYIKSLQEINLAATIDGLLRQAVHTQSEGNKSLAMRYYQLALGEINKNKNSTKFAQQSQEIAREIKKLKENQREIEAAAKEINKKLVDVISGKKDEGDSFEMKQIN